MMDDLPGNTERKICLCLNVTDAEIASAFAAGHRSLKEIRATTRACTRWTTCTWPGVRSSPRAALLTRL